MEFIGRFFRVPGRSCFVFGPRRNGEIHVAARANPRRPVRRPARAGDPPQPECPPRAPAGTARRHSGKGDRGHRRDPARPRAAHGRPRNHGRAVAAALHPDGIERPQAAARRRRPARRPGRATYAASVHGGGAAGVRPSAGTAIRPGAPRGRRLRSRGGPRRLREPVPRPGGSGGGAHAQRWRVHPLSGGHQLLPRRATQRLGGRPRVRGRAEGRRRIRRHPGGTCCWRSGCRCSGNE